MRVVRDIEGLRERFWAKVQLGDGCWLWNAAQTSTGYGHMGVTFEDGTRRNIKAHRIAWFLATGALPERWQHVCHHCDTPLCVRSEHLFLGTAKDNAVDRKNKGKAITHILTQKEREEVVELVRRGTIPRVVADIYQVSEANVRNLVKTHSNGEPHLVPVSPAQRQEIRRLHSLGVKQAEIARCTGVHQASVSYTIHHRITA